MMFAYFKCAIVHGESLAALIPNSSMQAIKEAGIDVEGFLTVGVSAALRQLLEFGLFHGDPHPGNIFAMRDGRIAYVDFGNVAVLSQVCKMLLFSSRILCTYIAAFFPCIYTFSNWYLLVLHQMSFHEMVFLLCCELMFAVCHICMLYMETKSG